VSTLSKPFIIPLIDEQRNLAERLGCAAAGAGGDSKFMANKIMRMLTTILHGQFPFTDRYRCVAGQHRSEYKAQTTITKAQAHEWEALQKSMMTLAEQ